MSKVRSLRTQLVLAFLALAAVLGAWVAVRKPMRRAQPQLPQVEIADIGPPFGVRREFDLRPSLKRGERVEALCFSPDSRVLVAGTSSGMLHVIDLADGATRALTAHQKVNSAPPITAIAFSPNGKRMLSADMGGVVRVWEWPDLAEVRTFDQGDWAGDAFFRMDDEIISSLHQEGEIKSLAVGSGEMREVFDVYKSRHYRPKEHLRPMVGRMALVGDLLAAVVWENVYFVDLKSGDNLRCVTPCGTKVLNLARVGSGREVAAATTSGVWMLDATDGRILQTLRMGTGTEVCSVAASPDGGTLAVAGYFVQELPGVLQT